MFYRNGLAGGGWQGWPHRRQASSHRGRAGFCKSGLGRCPCRDAVCFQARHRPVGERAFRDTRPFTRGPFKYWRPAQTMWERVHPRTPAQPVPCIALDSSRLKPLPQGTRTACEFSAHLLRRARQQLEARRLCQLLPGTRSGKALAHRQGRLLYQLPRHIPRQPGCRYGS